ncbi:hypothetical protein IAR55_005312 [Kwoniella newhampshirensis]|uniref:NAD-dependent epimerase/dehydratase domain-containing protein n=1 Tax=Kwoniella newhampshirensis TaxID=1651941 RepID=A0AAW0YW51_9TREE
MSTAKRVLITGLNGFVAPHVAITFLERGWTVRGTVRTEEKRTKVLALPGLKKWAEEGKVEVTVVPDLAKAEWLDVLKGIDAVAHVASPFNFTLQSYEDFATAAIQGTTNLLEAAAKTPSIKDVAVVGSIVSILDAVKPHADYKGETFTEDDWLGVTEKEAKAMSLDNPATSPYWYSVSKKYAELASQEVYKRTNATYGFATLCCPGIYGPPEHVSSAKELMVTPGADISTSTLFATLATGEDSPIGPTLVPHCVDVRDVALAVYLAITKHASGRFIISGCTNTVQQIANIGREARPDLAKHIPKGDPSNITLPPGTWKLDNSKSQKVLGLDYRPLEETVIDTVTQLEKIGAYNKG